MGIVFNVKTGSGYINSSSCRPTISRLKAVKTLTPQNLQFLKSLKLKVISPNAQGGK